MMTDERGIRIQQLHATHIPPETIQNTFEELAKAHERGDTLGEESLLMWTVDCGSDCGVSTSKAAEVYDQALNLARNAGDKVAEVQILTAIGNSYGKRGDTQRAVAYLEEALEFVQKLTIADFQRANRKNPANAPVRSMLDALAPSLKTNLEAGIIEGLGDIDASQERYASALAKYEEAISTLQLGDPSKILVGFFEAGIYLRMARVYRSMGNLSKAIELYDSAKSAMPGHMEPSGETPFERAEVYWQFGYREKAIANLQELLAEGLRWMPQPFWWMGYNLRCRLALYQLEVGRNLEARTNFEAAINGARHDIAIASHGKEAQEISSQVQSCFDGYMRLRLTEPTPRMMRRYKHSPLI